MSKHCPFYSRIDSLLDQLGQGIQHPHLKRALQSVPGGGRNPRGRELNRALSDHGFVTHTRWLE